MVEMFSLVMWKQPSDMDDTTTRFGKRVSIQFYQILQLCWLMSFSETDKLDAEHFLEHCWHLTVENIITFYSSSM